MLQVSDDPQNLAVPAGARRKRSVNVNKTLFLQPYTQLALHGVQIRFD